MLRFSSFVLVLGYVWVQWNNTALLCTSKGMTRADQKRKIFTILAFESIAQKSLRSESQDGYVPMRRHESGRWRFCCRILGLSFCFVVVLPAGNVGYVGVETRLGESNCDRFKTNLTNRCNNSSERGKPRSYHVVPQTLAQFLIQVSSSFPKLRHDQPPVLENEREQIKDPDIKWSWQ